MIDIALLKILADGKFHSGTDLGEVLGLSRSAIWKQMKAVEECGVEVYSVRGRGYRLPRGLDLLDLDRLNEHFNPQVKQALQLVDLKTFTDSTNLMALRNIREHNHGALYLTEYQSAGRGRRGRSWVGPVASNLYFSLIWRFNGGAASLQGLSLVVGLSVVQGLKELGVGDIELKWPNDLLSKGRKLAGILLEMQGDASGDVSVVIGVGINVLMNPQNKQNESIDQPWVDLTSITDRKLDRNKLLAAIINKLVSNVELFASEGFSVFVDAWQALHAYQDSYVKLIMSPNEVEGICRGVDQHGALLLERYGKMEAYHGGEISVRKLPGPQ
jgi:BirA family biotin operon repressor/biotin-[acetyl-CoA-carboxylase] ligase